MKFKVHKKNICTMFVSMVAFLICFNSGYIRHLYPFISLPLSYARVFFIFSIVCLMGVLRKKFSITTLIFSIMMLWIVYSTAYHGGSVFAAINTLTPVMVILLTIDYLKGNIQLVDVALNTWLWMIIVLLILDLISFYLFPTGMYRSNFYSNNWFLGYKTERMIYSLPAMLIAFYEKEKNGIYKFLPYVVAILAVISIFLSSASAGTVVFFILMMFFTYADIVLHVKSNKNGNRKFRSEKLLNLLLDYKFIVPLYIFITFIVVVIQNTDLISIVTLYFGKAQGLSNRTGIWEACLDVILTTPLTGGGFITSEDYIALSRNIYGTNAHNMFLTIAMNGGVIAVVLYLLMVAKALKTKNECTSITLLISVYTYCMFLLGITSSILVFSMFGLLPFIMMEYLE